MTVIALLAHFPALAASQNEPLRRGDAGYPWLQLDQAPSFQTAKWRFDLFVGAERARSQVRTATGQQAARLPLASEILQLLDHYLLLERPSHCGAPLFVNLKGLSRGGRIAQLANV